MPDRIEHNEILQLLPHRYPFLLIDAAEDYVAGKSIVGLKGVTAKLTTLITPAFREKVHCHRRARACEILACIVGH